MAWVSAAAGVRAKRHPASEGDRARRLRLKRRGAPPSPGTRYSAAVIAATVGPDARPGSLPLPSGSS